MQSSQSQQTFEEIAALFEIGEPAMAPAAQEIKPAGRRPFLTVGRALTVFLALGILACLGGFFAFVPALPALTVAVLLSGLLAMFWIGFHLGGRCVKC